MKKNHKTVAETIENHIRKVVNIKLTTNPEYYRKMSEILDNLIERRLQEKVSYREYLQEVSELAKKVQQVCGGEYPESIVKNSKLRALYDNLNKDEEAALNLDRAITTGKPDRYKENSMKVRRVKLIIKSTLNCDDAETERIYQIVEANYD
jgi:type I restriction enzyme R subunit